jgi:hypothetical protein
MEAPRIPISRFSYAAVLAVLLVVAAGAPRAATVAGLYEGTVPGEATETGRPLAAEAALRQVVVRVTGRRGASADPALASLYADAGRYVQTFRPAAGGQVVVGFDAEALDAALARAGQPIWSRERPLTLVVLVLDRGGQAALAGGVDAEEKRAVDRAAQLRGLPLAWPGAVDAATAQQRIDDVRAGAADALVEFARRYDATGVLYGRTTGTGVQWDWRLPVGSGAVAGTPADGVDGVADRYAAELTAGQAGAIALLPVLVTDTRGPQDYAAVVAALEAVPNVSSVRLEAAGRDGLTFRLNFRGDVEALRRAVAAGGRLVPQDGDGGTLRLRLPQ